MFLLRLCPMVPFSILNYLLGITGIKVRDFFLGGFGMIPGVFVRVFIGTTLSNISEATSGEFDGGPALLVLLIVGTILATIGIVYITIVTRRYLQ